MRELLAQISKAGEHAGTLTRQLLLFSRQSVLEPRVLDINGVVTDTEKMLGRLIGEDITLAMVLEPHLSPVKADPGQLQQALINLAVNGVLSGDLIGPQLLRFRVPTQRMSGSRGVVRPSPTSASAPPPTIIAMPVTFGALPDFTTAGGWPPGRPL